MSHETDFPPVNFHQFQMLRGMLERQGIPVDVVNEPYHKIIHYPSGKDWKLSVTLGIGTYGWTSGRLETWTGKDDEEPEGWRTADSVFKEIFLDYRGIQRIGERA